MYMKKSHVFIVNISFIVLMVIWIFFVSILQYDVSTKLTQISRNYSKMINVRNVDIPRKKPSKLLKFVAQTEVSTKFRAKRDTCTGQQCFPVQSANVGTLKYLIYEFIHRLNNEMKGIRRAVRHADSFINHELGVYLASISDAQRIIIRGSLLEYVRTNLHQLALKHLITDCSSCVKLVLKKRSIESADELTSRILHQNEENMGSYRHIVRSCDDCLTEKVGSHADNLVNNELSHDNDINNFEMRDRKNSHAKNLEDDLVGLTAGLRDSDGESNRFEQFGFGHQKKRTPEDYSSPEKDSERLLLDEISLKMRNKDMKLADEEPSQNFRSYGDGEEENKDVNALDFEQLMKDDKTMENYHRLKRSLSQLTKRRKVTAFHENRHHNKTIKQKGKETQTEAHEHGTKRSSNGFSDEDSENKQDDSDVIIRKEKSPSDFYDTSEVSPDLRSFISWLSDIDNSAANSYKKFIESRKFLPYLVSFSQMLYNMEKNAISARNKKVSVKAYDTADCDKKTIIIKEPGQLLQPTTTPLPSDRWLPKTLLKEVERKISATDKIWFHVLYLKLRDNNCPKRIVRYLRALKKGSIALDSSLFKYLKVVERCLYYYTTFNKKIKDIANRDYSKLNAQEIYAIIVNPDNHQSLKIKLNFDADTNTFVPEGINAKDNALDSSQVLRALYPFRTTTEAPRGLPRTKVITVHTAGKVSRKRASSFKPSDDDSKDDDPKDDELKDDDLKDDEEKNDEMKDDDSRDEDAANDVLLKSVADDDVNHVVSNIRNMMENNRNIKINDPTISKEMPSLSGNFASIFKIDEGDYGDEDEEENRKPQEPSEDYNEVKRPFLSSIAIPNNERHYHIPQMPEPPVTMVENVVEQVPVAIEQPVVHEEQIVVHKPASIPDLKNYLNAQMHPNKLKSYSKYVVKTHHPSRFPGKFFFSGFRKFKFPKYRQRIRRSAMKIKVNDFIRKEMQQILDRENDDNIITINNPLVSKHVLAMIENLRSMKKLKEDKKMEEMTKKLERFEKSSGFPSMNTQNIFNEEFLKNMSTKFVPSFIYVNSSSNVPMLVPVMIPQSGTTTSVVENEIKIQKKDKDLSSAIELCNGVAKTKDELTFCLKQHFHLQKLNENDTLRKKRSVDDSPIEESVEQSPEDSVKNVRKRDGADTEVGRRESVQSYADMDNSGTDSKTSNLQSDIQSPNQFFAQKSISQYSPYYVGNNEVHYIGDGHNHLGQMYGTSLGFSSAKRDSVLPYMYGQESMAVSPYAGGMPSPYSGMMMMKSNAFPHYQKNLYDDQSLYLQPYSSSYYQKRIRRDTDVKVKRKVHHFHIDDPLDNDYDGTAEKKMKIEQDQPDQALEGKFRILKGEAKTMDLKSKSMENAQIIKDN
ncbi:hypothetical protein SNEBB_002470 [Seison nebaliae]|nr:hypothetical protein SNEBB_002470 [Seison nebaliae]